MKNQVDAIRGISSDDNVAHVLNSSLTKEINKLKTMFERSYTKLLYVAPESLTKNDNINFLKSIKLSFFAIDEAHCILNGDMTFVQNTEFKKDYSKNR